MANADPDTVTWTRIVAGGRPINRADAAGGGFCAITGVWYPARMLKTVNGRRISRKIPIREHGWAEPNGNPNDGER